MADYINVTSLNRLARQVLAQCEPLNDLIVCGEISGFVRHYKSGHMYFTLKDETASVKSVMFRNSAQLLNFQPQNGMLVLAYGHATIYTMYLPVARRVARFITLFNSRRLPGQL